MPATQAPYSQYFDKNGQPLDAGYVWFGLPNENPKTSPVNVYWDADLTQPALQPIRTLAGYLARNGSPAQVFTDGAYSQIVENKRFEMVYYAANSADYSDLPIRVAVITATDGQTLVNLPFAYTRGNNSLAIYLNGLLLLKDRDYTETSTTSVTMIRPLKVGPGGADEVTAIGGRLINAASAIDAVSAAALAAGSGAGLVGFDASLTFPSGTVGERLKYETWVEDYYDAGAGASAWRLAFEGALAALGGPGTIRVGSGTKTLDDVFTVDVVGVTIQGQGSAAIGATAAQGATTIVGDHNNGPVIHFKQHSSRLCFLDIGASSARNAGAINGGTAAEPCCGVLYAGEDTSGGRADNMMIDTVRVYDQPFHGVIWSGSAANNIIHRLVTDRNLGHGWVIDRGDMTARTNTGSPGIFFFINPRSYDNGGHAWTAGNPNDTVLPTYRVTILQGETYRNGANGVVGGTPTLTTNKQLYANYQAYVRGDNNFVQQTAFGGDGPSSGGAAVTGGIYMAGRTSEVTNCRYIDCLAAAGCVRLGQVASTPSFGLRVNGLEVRTPDASMNPAVRLESGIIGVDVVNKAPSNITTLVSTAELATVTDYYIDDQAVTIRTDRALTTAAQTVNGNWTSPLSFRVSMLGWISIGSAGQATIASGAITLTRSYMTVDTEGGAATDDLDTINGGADGDIVYLRQVNSARDIVLKHATGNLRLNGATDKTLSSISDVIQLLRVAGNWCQVAFGDNAV